MRDTTAPWYTGGNGATNFTRHEAQKFARSIVESEAYRANLAKRAETGDLSPAMEALLWYYAYGKPVEQISLSVTQEDLSTLSVGELQERARKMLETLEEAKSLEEAIPVQYKVA